MSEKGNRNAYGSRCHFGKFAQGKGCPGNTILVIGDNRLCQHHLNLLNGIIRDANLESARHPSYRGKKVA